MAAKTTTFVELSEEDKADFQAEPAEGLILEADYKEDRQNSLLAERQREFKKSLRGHYVDTEISEERRTAFVQHLLAQGIIPAIPQRRLSPPPRPIPVRGKPVSETIIEERG